ncbi:MAG: hypothetical protein ABS85_13365 [Sphingobacteriales bacterium SCN 48-20]|uniref:hypothetical protein n=1 Tax=Terrimonas ferruginea TaxID=249 RepID=UPI00086C2ADC|nr:hypothetical protein [Terrimonas ferruginea]MBN8784476.1 hypothetical protein [Terrimonas ferruginea]ODT91182.1 MAG: hypothetical protein ABS85_13365 [Sphingobacteriales bacterium SCN 48-20]OJW40505.1 MAG: hypothetical protein BGO56_04055 [Sphingobacteriales bacterium 48-107]
MNKLIILLAFSCLTIGALHAQNPTFSPSTYTAEDQVTLTVDVTGTPMAGEAEAYIWIFSNTSIDRSNAALSAQYPAADGSTNTNWTNSPPEAKMTAAGTNKWSFTFIGTQIFGQSPAQLKDFGFLVKTKTGTKQTSDYKPNFFDPLVFTPTMLRVFPAKVSTSDIVTINFDRSLGGTVNEQRMTPVSATVTAYDETNAQIGTAVTLQVRVFATNTWAATFIPTRHFTPGAGHQLTKFRYKFNGTVLDVSGNTVNVSSAEQEVTFTRMN